MKHLLLTTIAAVVLVGCTKNEITLALFCIFKVWVSLNEFDYPSV